MKNGKHVGRHLRTSNGNGADNANGTCGNTLHAINSRGFTWTLLGIIAELLLTMAAICALYIV